MTHDTYSALRHDSLRPAAGCCGATVFGELSAESLVCRVGPMTLLGAIRTPRGILIAADSLSLDIHRDDVGDPVGTQVAVDKLWRLPGTDLVAGFAGDGATGLPFMDRLRGTAIGSWDQLAESAGRAMAQVSDEVQQTRTTRAGLTTVNGQRPTCFPLV